MQSLRLFADAARLQSLSQAAPLHGITQSAASQRIGALEKKLGLTLFDRSTRPLGLTRAGRLYLEGVEDILDRYDRVLRQIGAAGQVNAAGVVRVSAIYSAGIGLLERVKRKFEQEHPRARVEITYEKPDRVYERVMAGETELGILSYPGRFKTVSVVPLRDERMAVVCRPDHPLARLDRVTAKRLSAHAMVAFDEDLPVGRKVRAYLRAEGGSPKIEASFDTIDTIKSAAAVTHRFAILPERTVSREAAAGVLAVVPLLPELVRPVGVIHRGGHGGSLSAAAEAFVARLALEAGPDHDDESEGLGGHGAAREKTEGGGNRTTGRRADATAASDRPREEMVGAKE